jgi:hypothetical protein
MTVENEIRKLCYLNYNKMPEVDEITIFINHRPL